MSRQAFLKSQLLETSRLLELAGDHPLMSPGLRSRRDEITKELATLPEPPEEVKATLFFTGAPVFGSFGIDADFASKVLDPIHKDG